MLNKNNKGILYFMIGDLELDIGRKFFLRFKLDINFCYSNT